MTPMMNLFLRCMLALVLFLLLWSIADYSMAAGVPSLCAS